MYKIFAIMGIVGSIICALGDYFLYRCQGMDSVRIGDAKKIESGWKNAKIEDFTRSGILGAIGIPLYYFGMIAFSYVLSLENATLAIVYFIMITIASMGAVAFHLNACYMPVIYRTVSENGGGESMVEDIYGAMRKVCNLSSIITYALLVFVNSIFIYVVIFAGVIEVSKLLCLATPLSLFIIGNVFKKINNKVFHTFPLAVTNTLGLGGIAFIALISL